MVKKFPSLSPKKKKSKSIKTKKKKKELATKIEVNNINNLKPITLKALTNLSIIASLSS